MVAKTIQPVTRALFTSNVSTGCQLGFQWVKDNAGIKRTTQMIRVLRLGMKRFQTIQSKACLARVDIVMDIKVAIAAPSRPNPSPDSEMNR